MVRKVWGLNTWNNVGAANCGSRPPGYADAWFRCGSGPRMNNGASTGRLDLPSEPRPLDPALMTRIANAVLEVWPKSVDEPEHHEGNGHEQTEGDILYELAEFDFTELVKSVPLENFHFSQRRAVFEISWKEFGQDLELRVHIEPEGLDE